MPSSEWWTASVRAELSQGDILDAIPIVLAPMPIRYVKPQTFPKGIKGWVESTVPFKDSGGRTVLFSAGFISQAIVISHDCDLDDHGGSKTVLVARVELLESAPPEHRSTIAAQENLLRMFLPGIPGLGDCYANLRSVATIDRQVIRQAKRLASMTDDARAFLQTRLIKFLIRKIPPE